MDLSEGLSKTNNMYATMSEKVYKTLQSLPAIMKRMSDLNNNIGASMKVFLKFLR